MGAAMLVPLLAAGLIPFCGRWPNLREAVTLAAAGLLAVIVWALAPQIIGGARPAVEVGQVVPGLRIAFRAEPLGMIFALVAGSLWLVNSVYSIGYMRANNEPRQTVFYLCFAVAIAATMAIAFAANLFSLFVFYEVLTLCTYPLVTHKGTEAAMRAGRVYLGMLIGTSMVLLLPAIVLVGQAAGSLDFAPGGILAGKMQPVALGWVLALFVFGIGKAAVMPGHFWLPAAMVAPTPVSALLHAVAVVKAGVFALLKVIVFIFGLDLLAGIGTADWLVYVAGVTIILASAIALRQDNLKRLLAYSTVSQLSYVVMAAALFTPAAAVGAGLHIAVHAVAKITLFFAAGNIYTAAHKTEVSQLDGIGLRMPLTMAAFTAGAFAMIGVPLTAGFLSKWFILQGAMAAEHWFALAVVVVSTALNAGYFLPVIYRAFFCTSVDGHDHGEAPWPMVLAISLTAGAVLLLFWWPDVPLALAKAMIGG